MRAAGEPLNTAFKQSAVYREAMKVGYVVLYVKDAEACRRFWVEQVGMIEKKRTQLGGFAIAQVGFADQPFAFELVPLEMMKDNKATEIGEHFGMRNFAFSDPEGRWFAVS